MEMDVMPTFIEHHHGNPYDKGFVRRTVNASLHFVWCLDGHSSRNGMEWLDLSIDYKCDFVQSPANSSHFLQPCDTAVNKTFQRTVRTTRDELCSMTLTDTRSMQGKLMVGVTGHKFITKRDIRTSFHVTGLFSTDFVFAERWKRTAKPKQEKGLSHKLGRNMHVRNQASSSRNSSC